METILKLSTVLPNEEREQLLDTLVKYPSLIPGMEKRLKAKLEAVEQGDMKRAKRILEKETAKVREFFERMEQEQQS